MKKLFLCSLIYLCASGNFILHAQTLHLQPTPQKVDVPGQKIALPTSYGVTISNPIAQTFAPEQVMPNRKEKKNQFTVLIGKRGDKHLKRFSKLIPQRKEGYYLSITPKQIVIAGNDERGAYYGFQTLKQLIQGDSILLATVTDYPDIEYRGVVEGFYGTPWSHAARLRQIEFYGANKLNTYIYGPKDDPYHTSPNWRKPYPAKEEEQIKQLVKASAENQVDFVWAIHPGGDIKWTNEDRDALIDKFEKMYSLGVRSFAVFFDDISGEGTKADRQAELLNYIDDHFVKVKKDVTPLVMCPTEYNKSWSNVKGGYLTTLGDKLNPSVQIMWTGDRVIACIDKPTMDWINPLLKRKAYIWWNFPVSDYVRDHLLLGAVYGNGLDIKDDMAGFVANPMERSEASKISLYSVADYAWNLKAYKSEDSWNLAMKALMPRDYDHLKTFASHNSDLGPNGHGFRRDESVELQPTLQTLLSEYKNGSINREAYRTVRTELNKICTAADYLMVNEEAPYFVEEVKPWLRQFKLMGEYGKEVMQMMMLAQSTNHERPMRGSFESTYHHARTLQKQMFELDAFDNQNPYQPGVKTGSKVLLPTLNELFSLSTEIYNKTQVKALDAKAVYSPYKLESNVPQLKIQPIQNRGRNVNVSPSNEVIKWPAGAHVTVSMEKASAITHLQFDLGTPAVATLFACDIYDGKVWIPAKLTQESGKNGINAEVPAAVEVKMIRLSNNTGEEKQVYFKRFSFSIQGQ